MFLKIGLVLGLIPFKRDIFYKLHCSYNIGTMQIHTTSELTGARTEVSAATRRHTCPRPVE